MKRRFTVEAAHYCAAFKSFEKALQLYEELRDANITVVLYEWQGERSIPVFRFVVEDTLDMWEPEQ